MSKKQNKKLIWIVAAIIAVIAIYFIALKPEVSTPAQTGVSETKVKQGQTVNGLWITGKCQGPKNYQGTFFHCCFNQGKQQVDCNNARNLLDRTLAIYQGTPGIFYVTHGVRISNIGNIPIDASITGAGWTSSPLNPTGDNYMTTAYSGMVNNVQRITVGNFYDWNSDADQVAPGIQQIDLQSISASDLATVTTYTLALNSQAVDFTGNIPTSTKTTNQAFTIQREGIAFEVTITF